MRINFHPVWIPAVLLFLPVTASAATLSTEDLMNMPLEKLIDVEVTSASKYKQKESEAPSVVEVISAEDIRTYGYRTLGDALNGLHGLYTSSDRYYTYLGNRGFLRSFDFNSRMLIMVDGRRMNNNIYDEADTGQLFMLDMDLVDHIEYIAGPGSSIYGGNALLGVINVVTKKGADINGMQVMGMRGSFETNAGRATYGKRFNNGADVLVSASQYYSLGPSDLFFPALNSPATNNGDAHKLDAERAKHLFAKVMYQDFTFTSGFVDRFKQIPTFNDIFADHGTFTYDSQFYGEAKYDTNLSSKTQLELEAFEQWYDYHANYPYDSDLTPGFFRTVNNDASYGNWWGGEVKIVTTAFNRQKLVTGIEYEYDQREHIENYDENPHVVYEEHNRTGRRVGIYAQDDITLLQNLILSTGLRVDQNHMIKKEQVNPRLGLIWHPRSDTTMKLLYGSAFRAPNVNERDVFTTPNNSEEHIKTYEFATEWEPGTGLKLSGSLFYNDYTQVLQIDPVTQLSVNSGKFISHGYELGAEKRWTDGRSAKASFEHVILYDESLGDTMWAIDSPKNVGKLQFAQLLWNDKAKIGIDNVYVSRRKTFANSMAAAYDLVNVNLTSNTIMTGLDAALGVYNVFDTHAQMVGDSAFAGNVLPMNGRSVQLRLQFTF